MNLTHILNNNATIPMMIILVLLLMLVFYVLESSDPDNRKSHYQRVSELIMIFFAVFLPILLIVGLYLVF